MMPVTEAMNRQIRLPYALRRVPESSLAHLLPCPQSPQPGDIALARLEKIGRHARLELTSGRACNLQEGDLLAVVFGNRYATEQFEGYASAEGELCHLLSMAGVCGLVISKHADIGEPSKLRLLGALGDAWRRPLQLRDFALPSAARSRQPAIIVVCGTAMETGKTHTAKSLVMGLRQEDYRVASIKLTGTAAGRDTWSMLDAGASPALDFVDGGFPSTYLCTTEELLDLYGLLAGHAAQDADWIVIEIADGLFQRETAALMRSRRFTATVDGWILAASEPLAAAGGVHTVRALGIEPLAISGRLSMSSLAAREAEAATGLPCLTAGELQRGKLNERLIAIRRPDATAEPLEDGDRAAVRTA